MAWAAQRVSRRKRHYLTEIIPLGPRRRMGPRAAKDAEKARTRLMSQVDEQRNPRTRATVNQLLDRHLEMLGVEETTLDSYESFARNHIRPTCSGRPIPAAVCTRATSARSRTANVGASPPQRKRAPARRCRALCG
jgi:hypothetical protein